MEATYMLLDTPLCNFGWKAPAFTLKDADGIEFSLSNYAGQRGLLITFICNHCPYVQAIGKRLAEDTYMLMNEGIAVLAIMSNDYRNFPEDGPAHMKKFATHFGFPFPYLVDEDQSVGKAFGAVCTPDFFGFNKNGELQYRGRLDSIGMKDQQNRKRELVDAMRQIAETGQGPLDQKPSMGCSIKWASPSTR
jgi:peroxiredoxin